MEQQLKTTQLVGFTSFRLGALLNRPEFPGDSAVWIHPAGLASC
jgi:hypothetical protein